jgi:hypothetical protein
MKPSAFRIERMLEKLEAALVPPERKWLRVIIDGDDEMAVAKKKEEAVAEHVASHPEDAGRTVEDFNWIERTLVRPRPIQNNSGPPKGLAGRPVAG